MPANSNMEIYEMLKNHSKRPLPGTQDTKRPCQGSIAPSPWKITLGVTWAAYLIKVLLVSAERATDSLCSGAKKLNWLNHCWDATSCG